nr:MAG TPA: hypothetical protein [Caudoviricetes sp.]DAM36832.1 MAG TPA: hypothetical protein [Caudoviricetes sp.]
MSFEPRVMRGFFFTKIHTCYNKITLYKLL